MFPRPFEGLALLSATLRVLERSAGRGFQKLKGRKTYPELESEGMPLPVSAWQLWKTGDGVSLRLLLSLRYRCSLDTLNPSIRAVKAKLRLFHGKKQPLQ